MKSIGGRLRGQEKAKQGQDKKKNEETHTAFTLLGTEQLTFTAHGDGISGDKITMRVSMVSCFGAEVVP